MQITTNNLIKFSQGEIDDLIDWAKRVLAPTPTLPNIVLLDYIDRPQDMLTARVALLLEGMTKVAHDLHADRFWGVVEERERYGVALPEWTYDLEKRKDGIERWQGPKHWGYGEKHTVRVTVTAAKIRAAMNEVGVDLTKLTIATSNGPRPLELPYPDDRYGLGLVADWREYRRTLSARTRAKNAKIREEVKAEMATTDNTDIERIRLMETNRRQEQEIARLRAIHSERNVDSSRIKQLEKDVADLVGHCEKLAEDNAIMASFIAKVQQNRIDKQRQAEIAKGIQNSTKGTMTHLAVPRGFKLLEVTRDMPMCFHDYITN